MNSLNSVLLEGNLLKDPQEGRTADDIITCRFEISVQRFSGTLAERKKEVSYFDIKTRNILAESCLKHLKQGRGVRIVGRLVEERWVDDDEKHCSKVHIFAEHVEFKPVVKTDAPTGYPV